MHISAKSDYAIRACLELAAADGGPLKGDAIAANQKIPAKFLETIMRDLRHAGLVRSQRGADGGYWLAHPANEISIADVIRAADGPLAWIRGERPQDVHYEGPAQVLSDVWIATRVSVRAVLEKVTLHHVVTGKLPASVKHLAADPEARISRV